jgi:hypothetical protein
MESVHVELTHERRYVGVFEVLSGGENERIGQKRARIVGALLTIIPWRSRQRAT